MWPGVEPHGVIPDHHQVLQFALVFAVLCHVEGEEAVRASDGVAFSLGDTSEEVAASLLVGWRRQEPEDKVDTVDVLVTMQRQGPAVQVIPVVIRFRFYESRSSDKDDVSDECEVPENTLQIPQTRPSIRASSWMHRSWR